MYLSHVLVNSDYLDEACVAGEIVGPEVLESFSFWDEYDHEYEIFSILSSTRARTNVILAGKSDKRRHSTTSFSENVVLAGTSLITILTFLVKKGKMKLSGVSFFWNTRKNFIRTRTRCQI